MSWCQQIHFCSLCHKWKLLIDWVSNIFFISYIDLKNVRNGARFRKEWAPSLTNSVQYLTQHYTYVLVTFSRSLLHPLCCIPLLGLLLSLKFKWIIRLLALSVGAISCLVLGMVTHCPYFHSLAFSKPPAVCRYFSQSLHLVFQGQMECWAVIPVEVGSLQRWSSMKQLLTFMTKYIRK